MNHLDLQPLVTHFGSKEAAFRAIQEAVVKALEQKSLISGLYEADIVVAGIKIRVRGKIFNREVRIGTVWVP